MAKTPNIKKKGVSIHSRAARRNEDPAQDLRVKQTTQETEYNPWIHSASNAGVSKKRRTKQVSRQQKLRQQKALERADQTVSKLEKKVADSKGRARKIQARRKAWEDLNDEVVDQERIVHARALEDGKATDDGGKAANTVNDDGLNLELPDLEQPSPPRVDEYEVTSNEPQQGGGDVVDDVDLVT